MPERHLKKSKMSKVLCIGDSCADILIPYGELKSGRDASVSFSCGGSGANSVYALAKLNVPVSFCARAGKDLYGREMKRQLEEAGADTKHFILDEDMVSTQILVVIDENRDRFPLLMPKENPSYLKITEEDLKAIDLKDTEYILSNGMMLFDEPAAPAICDFLKKAHERGIQIIIDVNYRVETLHRDRKYLDEVLKIADHILGSKEDDFLPLTGESDIEKALRHFDGKQALVVRNREGSAVYHEGKQHYARSFDVKVEDTLGAGDAFNAGYIYGLLRHMSEEECNILGCACAGYCVAGKGARHIPSENELLNMLKERIEEER